MTWMVTGGAGYIGAHVVRALREAGRDVVVLDDFSSGFADFVPGDVPVVRESVLNVGAVTAALGDHGVSGVVHCAGFKYAGLSVDRPLHTWRQNAMGTLALLEAMDAAEVSRLVFSGSAAVYGTPRDETVTEGSATSPESPYGHSKLAAEAMIRDSAAAARRAGGELRHVTLRYFNVIGSAADGVYDASPTNVVPRAIRALQAGRAPEIHGDDYDTADGTAVRDYVDVGAIARAHAVAATALESGNEIESVYNLGSGTGTSVRQLVTAALRVASSDLEPAIGPRRAGDPARIVASGELAARDLEWAPSTDVDAMVRSAWRAAPPLADDVSNG